MKSFLFLAVLLSAVVFAVGCVSSNLISLEPAAGRNEIKNIASPDGKRTPVIVELFTSEGCSSCPPADKTLELLLKEQPFAGAEIIGLSLHIDYWNRLGWADPFSSAQFSERQSEYANLFKREDVYTPQMVVDGRREFVGSNMREAQKAIEESAKIAKADVTISAKTENGAVALDIKIENLPPNFENAVVMLAVTENNLASSVLRGENSGRKLNHAAVTRKLTSIGNIKSGEKSFAAAQSLQLEKNWKTDNLSAVVFVQDAKTRQIIGAAKISLNNSN